MDIANDAGALLVEACFLVGGALPTLAATLDLVMRRKVRRFAENACPVFFDSLRLMPAQGFFPPPKQPQYDPPSWQGTISVYPGLERGVAFHTHRRRPRFGQLVDWRDQYGLEYPEQLEPRHGSYQS